MQRRRNFFDRFRRPPAPGVSKHLQLRETLLRALDAGHWKAGDQLPTETELTRFTPFSLGTVQRAVRSLVEDGVVRRRRGHGSFITDQRARMQDPLHYRFLSADGASELPVYPKVLSRRSETRAGPWSGYLEPRGRAVLRIDRLFSINGEFSVYSRFYVDPERYGALSAKSLKSLHTANFSKLLGRELNTPVSDLYQRACVIRFPAEVCRAIKARRATAGMLLEIVGYAGGGQAVYYQEIYVPPTGRRLVLSGKASVDGSGGTVA